MSRSVVEVLRVQGQGITGALLVVGLSTMYTMETWWLGFTLPLWHVLGYGVGGLVVVFVTTRIVGIRDRDDEDLWETLVDFSELVVQSFTAAVIVLAAFGVVDLDTSPSTVARLGLVQVVPLGFGASLARLLLQDNGDERTSEADFPRNLPTFALGAAFVTFPMAPTDEVISIAVQAGSLRIGAVIVLSVAFVHVVLHEVDYRDQSERIADRRIRHQIGLAFVAYATASAVAGSLLLGFGHFGGASAFEAVQLLVVLSFPASVGAAGAEVVL